MYKKISQQSQPKGTWVVYECSYDRCQNYLKSGQRIREKVFEPR
jgi:hypothetical protein